MINFNFLNTVNVSFCLFVCLFSETGYYCVPCPGACFIDQTSLELTEVLLPQPPSAGMKGVCHCVQLPIFFNSYSFTVLLLLSNIHNRFP